MHSAATDRRTSDAEERPAMLPLRDDTFLGVCQAVGDDFGFNANWLRIALAAGLLWNAEAMVAVYLALGVIVAIARLGFPDRRLRVAAQAPEAPANVAEIESERLAA